MQVENLASKSTMDTSVQKTHPLPVFQYVKYETELKNLILSLSAKGCLRPFRKYHSQTSKGHCYHLGSKISICLGCHLLPRTIEASHQPSQPKPEIMAGISFDRRLLFSRPYIKLMLTPHKAKRLKPQDGQYCLVNYTEMKSEILGKA
ncbi:hypothetical protein O181_031138 [Austropuccinia psidii MF-1]|uniref:Uncharacterized protein n=1 Tax=Austropuccinia psidii MF-1 TaxID=1389203 RepID=A0A9Q3H4B3_9BASI|nr:hypothetical protein [Austropuccinia psidii MF-1]